MNGSDIKLDETLLRRAKYLTGLETDQEVVDCALRELIRRNGPRRILELKGRVDWEGDLAAIRQGRDFEALG